jgi:hypothetical protein
LTPETASEPTPELAADALTVVLAAVPAEDWGRTWAADRTIMLIMTSKGVKELVDRVSPPAAVRLREENLTGRGQKLPFMLKQSYGVVSVLPHHTTRAARTPTE